MELYCVFIIFSVIYGGVFCTDLSDEKQEDEISMLLYDEFTLAKLIITRNGFNYHELDLKINSTQRLEYDPINSSLLWNESGTLMYRKLNYSKRTKYWRSEEFGQILHQDWTRALSFWLKEKQSEFQNEALKFLDMKTGENHSVELGTSGQLEAIDPTNNVFLYKSGYVLKIIDIQTSVHFITLDIGKDFTLMDVDTLSRKFVIQTNNDGGEIKVFSYEGCMLYSAIHEKVFDQVIIEGHLLIMKKKDEIVVIDTTSKETKRTFVSEKFFGLNLKRTDSSQVTEEIPDITHLNQSQFECSEIAMKDVCIFDQTSLSDEDLCHHQSYVLTNGTTFIYYSPVTQFSTFPVSFTPEGGIRAFAAYKRNILIWIQNTTNLILMIDFKLGLKPVVLHSAVKYPSDLTLDEDTQYLYWSDEGKGTIEVASLFGKLNTVLFNHLNHPRALFLGNGLIYWIEGHVSNMIKSGSLTRGPQRVIYQSEDPIFGYVIDRLNNILYAASQTSHLSIQALSLNNLTDSREVFQSEIGNRFTQIFTSHETLYLWSSGSFWRVDTANRAIWRITKPTVPNSFIFPIRCVLTDVNNEICSACDGFCFPVSHSSTDGMKQWECVEMEDVKDKKSYYDGGFILSASSNSVFHLSDDCTNEIASFDGNSIRSRQPLAHDQMGNITYIAAGNKLYEVREENGRIGKPSITSESIEDSTILFFNEGISPLLYNTSYDVYSELNTKNNKIPKKAFEILTNVEYVIPYPKRDVYFFVLELTSTELYPSGPSYYAYGIYAAETNGSYVQIFYSWLVIHEIKLSYEENRIYFIDGQYLDSVRVDGNKSKYVDLNLPKIKTFCFLNRKMYFVSESTGLLHRLNHLSENPIPEVFDDKPKHLIFLSTIVRPNYDVNSGCAEFRDEDGDCFTLSK